MHYCSVCSGLLSSAITLVCSGEKSFRKVYFSTGRICYNKMLVIVMCNFTFKLPTVVSGFVSVLFF